MVKVPFLSNVVGGHNCLTDFGIKRPNKGGHAEKIQYRISILKGCIEKKYTEHEMLK